MEAQKNEVAFNVQVILDHPDFVVINKPEGMSVHKDDQEQGLISLVSTQLQCSSLYLVHRLDKMTSGLLILAKHEASNRILSQLFQARQVSKYYLAISNLKPKKKQGLIKGDMEKSRGGSWKLMPRLTNPAVTQFFSHSISNLYSSKAQAVQSIGSSVAQGLRLFVLKPHTGKTHQLRVALKSIGSPILGDARYYSQLKNALGLTLDRGYLHAWRLSFVYQDQTFNLEALPSNGVLFNTAELREFLVNLGDPALMPWPKL